MVDSEYEPAGLDNPRVLLVGALLPAGRNAGHEATEATSLLASPTLHDFGIIVCRYSNAQFLRAGPEKWGEWARFLSAGGRAFIVGVEPSVQRHILNILGKPFTFDREAGKELSWKTGPAIFSVLKDRKCSKWSLSLPREHEKDVVVLARNNGGAGVAFQMSVGLGLVAFLPSFEGAERRKLVRDLLRFGEEEWRRSLGSRRPPPWVAGVRLESERELDIERQRIDNRLAALARAKSLTFETGFALSQECYRVLQDLLASDGFTVSWREREGSHDLEIASATLTLVGEVRGTSGPADIELARQLMHHVQVFRPLTSELKGLIIANAYRDLPVDRRPEPFTKECRKLAEQNAFCLMTSTQLLHFYDMAKTDKFSATQFIELVRATNGVLTLPPGASSLLG